MELVTEADALDRPAGRARDDPNQNPTLDPPKLASFFFIPVAVAPEPLGTEGHVPLHFGIWLGTEGHRRASLETRHVSRRMLTFYRRSTQS